MAREDFRPDFVNLKYVGAAFDEAIEDLRRVKTHARDKSSVDAKIERLQELHELTRKECPQFWYMPFELEESKRKA